MSGPEEPELDIDNEPITGSWVMNRLDSLRKEGVLEKIRLLVLKSEYFAGDWEGKDEIESNWIQPSASTRTVLDIYRELLDEDNEVTINDFTKDKDGDKLKKKVIKALKPDTNLRKLLLAYWDTNEDQRWSRSVNKIGDIQEHNSVDVDIGFPAPKTSRRVLQRLGVISSSPWS